MNNFPDKLLLEDVGTKNGTQVFKLLADFAFISKKHGRIVARKGFESTGISSPRIIWPLVGPTSRAFKISLIHDVLFSKNSEYNLTRKESNDVMMEGMIALGIPWWERQAIDKALRMFSWMFWKKA